MMFGVWIIIVISTVLLPSNCHFETALSCFCNLHNIKVPVFENNVADEHTSMVYLENKCFAGSIRGQLFCPTNQTFCIKLEDLYSVSCHEILQSQTEYRTNGTGKRSTLNTGIEHVNQKRFLVSSDDSQWSGWGPWQECVALSCGEFGVHNRNRICLSAHCNGDSEELDSCFKNCTVSTIDGQWSEWSDWDVCSSFTDKGAITHRSRKCDNPPVSNGGKPCDGRSWEIITCTNLTGWGSWGSWSICYQTEGIDLQIRNRSCRNQPCDGTSLGTRLCNVNPASNEWSPWGVCSVTCGKGEQTRHRDCGNSTDIPGSPSASNIPTCLGSSLESKNCTQPLCDSNTTVWSEWSAWTFCEPPCDSGTSTRNRVCYQGSCQGDSKEQRTCTQSICNIDGEWSTWEEWSACDYGPSYNVTVRFRSCSNPPPSNDGNDCTDNYWDIKPCTEESVWGPWGSVGPCIKTGSESDIGLQYRNRTCHVGMRQESCQGRHFTFEACNLKGQWSDWGNWSSCSVTCGEGTHNRQRQCNSVDGGYCEGHGTETQTCTDRTHCPVDGVFSEWTTWSSCHVTCGGGQVSRNRYCNNPSPQYGGTSCIGLSSEKHDCNTRGCPVDGHWTDWSAWQACSKTCGNGTRERTRSCSNPAPANEGVYCLGHSKGTENCNEAVCSVDGEWGEWQPWAECTCQKTQQRKRDCDNPTPVAGGADCVGEATDTAPCTPESSLHCPVNGGWANWLEWGLSCSVTCGHGVTNRYRQCSNPVPKYGGAYCAGDLAQQRDCVQPHCPIDGDWSSWSAWSACDVTCANGTQSRSRTCNNPKPEYGGQDCQGGVGEWKQCTLSPCPVNGVWSEWLAWSSWDVTCAQGSRSRIRKCDNPAPLHGGYDCPGDYNGHESKDLGHCPEDGAWSDWTVWSRCSVTCENGTHTRTRTCSNPPPRYGGLDCVGEKNETQVCSDKPSCAIDGNWSNWSNWFGCSVTCGGGYNVRYRSCNNPVPENHGKPCLGSFKENITCNSDACPVDGNWADWGAWASCSATCSHGTTVRLRNCSNPAPNYGGKQCDGNSTDTKDCFDRECPINGAWADWSSWYSCSTTCGEGYRLHSRTCTKPAPQYGGDSCLGPTTGNETCTVVPCPIDGMWGSWQMWGDCSKTCGNGTKIRSRTCDSPPQYGGADCSGINQQADTCFETHCPIDGSWAPWQPWSPCTGDCTAASKQRFRSCSNPTPQYGGDFCQGQGSEAQSCLPGHCTTTPPQTSAIITSVSPLTTKTSITAITNTATTKTSAAVTSTSTITTTTSSTATGGAAITTKTSDVIVSAVATTTKMASSTNASPVTTKESGTITNALATNNMSATTTNASPGTTKAQGTITNALATTTKIGSTTNASPVTTKAQGTITNALATTTNLSASTTNASPVTTKAPDTNTNAFATTTKIGSTTNASPVTTKASGTFTNAFATITSTSAATTNISATTTTPGASIDFRCFECDTSIPELCGALKREKICHEPYCINELTNTADGKKLIDRRCGTKHECEFDWWQTTSDNDKCTLFDMTETVTNYVHCTFCCKDELCNDQVIPSTKSLYKPP